MAASAFAETGFRETAAMSEGRNSHSATMLNDGRVLIAGGRDARHRPIASAGLYDPANETFTLTGPLPVPMTGHSAVKLADGRVLLTGAGNEASLFDPAADGFVSVPFPEGWVAQGPSVLLADGRVLISGRPDSQGRGKCIVLDPVTMSWQESPSMIDSRQAHTLTLLNDGRVLACGGRHPVTGRVLGTSELRDPSTGAWASASPMAEARERHTATLLPDGRVAVCGGSNRDPLASVEWFDPLTAGWVSGPPMSTARDNHAAAYLPASGLVVCGGNPVATGVLSSSEVLAAGSTAWAPLASMLSSRCLHTATPIGENRLLVVGGWGAYHRRFQGDFNLAIRDIEEFGPIAPVIEMRLDGSTLVTGSTVDFGKIKPGQSSERELRIANTGTAPLEIRKLVISGAHASKFSVQSSMGSWSVPPRQSITLPLRFLPLANGDFAATLDFESNLPVSPRLSIALQGSAFAQTLFPEITVEQTGAGSINDGAATHFGTMKTGSTEASILYTIRNTGQAPLTGISISITGPHAKDFILKVKPRALLAPGASTRFRIAFQPSATGRRAAALRIASNDADENPFDIRLSGTGSRQ